MTPPLKIAIVEDHHDLRELMIELLCREAHDAVGFNCADDLNDYLVSAHPDLILLDINLPGEDGFSIAERLKKVYPELFIIMITARDTIGDRIHGYTIGADIYLTKPITPPELLAAVGSIARRIAHTNARPSIPHLRLNPVQQQLQGPLGMVSLTSPEVLLLKALAEAPQCRLDYWRCLELLRIDLDEKAKASLEVRIHRLKKKMHQVGAPVPAIKSLWKEAYQLCTPVQMGH